MATINSSSLFHFTRRMSWLKGIISKGIGFSFSYEQLPNEEFGVAIPMACFCDIPLLRTLKHKERYGSYMIGLDKEILIECYSAILNPVIYVQSENLLSATQSIPQLVSKIVVEQMKELIGLAEKHRETTSTLSNEDMIVYSNEIIEKSPEINKLIDHKHDLNFIQGLFKPYEEIDENGKRVCYYDEREWRAFYPDGLSKEQNWVWDIKEDCIKNDKKIWNKNLQKTEYGHIKLIKDILQQTITHIIVPKESDIPEIIEHILHTKTIFGVNDADMGDRYKLISRITSFERIEDDY